MKKFVLGILIALIGCSFTLFCFIYAACNPCIVNGAEGLFASFVGNDLLAPFIISAIVMCAGIAVCAYEAYHKGK